MVYHKCLETIWYSSFPVYSVNCLYVQMILSFPHKRSSTAVRCVLLVLSLYWWVLFTDTLWCLPSYTLSWRRQRSSENWSPLVNMRRPLSINLAIVWINWSMKYSQLLSQEKQVAMIVEFGQGMKFRWIFPCAQNTVTVGLKWRKDNLVFYF